MTDSEVHARLNQQHPEYRRLAEKHRSYDVRLQELAGKLRLNPTEEVECINLKKYKLRLKDRMQAIARAYGSGS
jgi:uncharacterized protein YdcH (DUF465 family)